MGGAARNATTEAKPFGCRIGEPAGAGRKGICRAARPGQAAAATGWIGVALNPETREARRKRVRAGPSSHPEQSCLAGDHATVVLVAVLRSGFPSSPGPRR
jgi:hypothetical protein